MKQIFTPLFLTALLFTAGTAFAQFDTVLRSDDPGKNLIKINVPSIVVNNFSIQYERAVGKKISAGLSFRFMPKSGLPLKGQLENLIDDDDTWDQIEDMKTSNFAFTPEVRFYFGKSVFRGFYVAPFAKIAHYTADLPDFEYDVALPPFANAGTYITQKIPLSGKLNTITGGVLIGAQWKLSKLLYLDWWILGPQYGHAKGDVAGTKRLESQAERDALREELEDIDVPFAKTEVTVDENGGRLDIKGPWTGLRAGLNLGVRF